MKRSHAKISPVPDHLVHAIPSARPPNHEQLIFRALAGDPVAENLIFRQHVRYLLNLATRLTRSVSDGDDVVQDTFVMAFRKLESLEDPSAMRPWLTRILLSRIQKCRRARRLQAFFGFKPLEEDASLQQCAAHGARPDLWVELGEVDRILQRMPERWRLTWMLHRIEGLTIYETARAMNRSTASVKRYVAAVDTAVRAHWRGAP